MEESKKLYLATFTLCSILYLEKDFTRRSMMHIVWATSEEEAIKKVHARFNVHDLYLRVEDISVVEAID